MENENLMIAHLRKGDKLAFKRLYMKYHKLAYGIAYKYLNDTSLAEDAIQNVFLKIWERRETIEEDIGIKSYLMTILKNHLINELRNQQRSQLHNCAYSYETDIEDHSPEDNLHKKELTYHLNRSARSLSPQKKKIYELKIQEGLSNQEVADALNLSINTVKVQYTQIVKDLRKKLQELGLYHIWVLISLLKGIF